jgi:hypothetical protein
MRKIFSAAHGEASARRVLVGANLLAIAAGGVTWAGCGGGGDDQAQTTGEQVERHAEMADKPTNRPGTAVNGKKATPKADRGARKQVGEQTSKGETQKKRPTGSQGDVRQQKTAGRGDSGSATAGQGDPGKDLAEQKAGGTAGGTGQGDASKDLAEQKKAEGR